MQYILSLNYFLSPSCAEPAIDRSYAERDTGVLATCS